MKADIITIGDEILIGQIIDSNSAYLGEQLTKLGFLVRRTVSIGDNADSIITALNDSVQNSDLIILTGGLGPTNDDITKDTLTRFFHGNYILHEASLNIISQFFALRGREMTERNRRQAEVPDTCEPLLNRIGTAPGMLFRKENKIIFSLPGVPFEMQALFENEVMPRILQHFTLPVRLQKTILTTGLSESDIADRLAKFENELDKELKLAYLPSPGLLRLRLSISGNNIDYLNKKLNDTSHKIVAMLGGQNVFGYDDDALPKVIGEILRKYNYQLSVAESCTGGNIAHLITSVPGASAYFRGGIVAYANDIKKSMLHVDQSTLEKFGAVSCEVVEQMALGARKIMNTDFSIATSGIAGPDGGSSEKPVGTTWIAVATPEKVVSRRFLFGDNRERNIIRASLTALNMLRNVTLQYIKNSI